ncbi:hypothetical protein [Rhizobium mesosinicum]|uniref:hypothetical protein n=1 Tax=Rhizobium mesosinicum TaxID=335017 RepID=UPI001CB7A2D9|nr:hypothetical protein [Rhizobium mesosinicum]
MPIDNAKLAPMQPGVPVEELKAALGTNWEEPRIQAKGRLHIEEFGTRITADGRLPSSFPPSMASGSECRRPSCVGFIPTPSAFPTKGRNTAGSS